MKIKTTQFLVVAIAAILGACSQPKQSNEVTDTTKTVQNCPPQLNSYISIFEIPATDISRAINFYESILSCKIEKMEMEGFAMGLLPYQNQSVVAVIMQGEGYNPSADGVTIYLNGGENLQTILDKVESNGGTIIVPKTKHADESGYFALFLDTEGNRLGLHSIE